MKRKKQLVLSSFVFILVVLTLWNIFYIDYLYKNVISRVSRSSLIEYQKADQIFSEPLPQAWHRELIGTSAQESDLFYARENDENQNSTLDESQSRKRNYTYPSPTQAKHKTSKRNDTNPTIAQGNKAPNKHRTRIRSGSFASPTYHDYKSMIEDDHSVDLRRTLPREDICQYFGLRTPVTTRDKVNDDLPACRPRVKTEEECRETIGYYGIPGTVVASKCEGNPHEPICTVKHYKPSNKANKIDVTCDIKKCKQNIMFLGFLNEDTGLTTKEDWIQVTNNSRLRQHISHHVKTSEFSSSYALVKCKNLQNDKDIKQTLFLPRIVQIRKDSTAKKQISINVIVEDSLSRNHFFRSLPKTKETLRNILHSSTSKATVLDFEMIQAFSSYTWLNMVRFFAAGENDKETLGQEVLYRLFKHAGYSTFYQEDSCWFDRWATMLYKDMVAHVSSDKKKMFKKWIKFKDKMYKQNFTHFIDDFGLTHHTCTVFKEMNVSNIYSKSTTCYNGEYLSSLYFRHLKSYIDALQKQSGTAPYFAYTHVLTSHESSGKRIASDDDELSSLMSYAAKQHNTLTILLSDHGAKSTPFSIKTNQGRYEVFQPLMFMIVPDNVAQILGRKVMDALVVNQKRLANVEDLHFALRSLVQNTQNENNSSNGLFSPIPLQRTCDDIHFQDNEPLCRCDGWHKTVNGTSVQVQWAAEIALGYINNKIQNVQNSHNTTSRCQRYSGKSVKRSRISTTTKNHILSFTLIVKPLFIDREEIFEIDVTYPVGWIDRSHVTNIVRVSRYDRYAHCSEPAIAELCTCNKNVTFRHSDIIRKAEKESKFTRKSETQMLDDWCLGIIKRARQRLVLNTTSQDALVTYEAFNNCSHVAYTILFGRKKQFYSRLSTSVPFSVELLPNSLTHLVTLSNFWKSGIFIPRIEFKKRKL